MGILRGVSGKVLDCGCLVGVYERYDGAVVQVVDAVSETCRLHRKGEAIGSSARRPDEPGAKP
jgi:hypothetical protein